MENKETKQEVATQVISDSQLLNFKLDKILELLNNISQKLIPEEREGVFKLE